MEQVQVLTAEITARIASTSRATWWCAGLAPLVLYLVARWHYRRRIVSRVGLTTPRSPLVHRVLNQCGATKPSGESLWVYWPLPWFHNAHLQTISLFGFRKVVAAFDREMLALEDGGQLGIDWLKDRRVPSPDDQPHAPILVIVHGLSGGSNESNVRTMALTAVAKKWRPVVINSRGVAGTKLTSPKPYNGGYTEDVRAAIKHIHKRYPVAPLLAVGYSLGANLLLRYAGQEGDKCLLRGVLCVSSPFQLSEATKYLRTSRMTRWYDKKMLEGLKKYSKKHIDVLKTHPSADLKKVFQSKTVMEFDDTATSVFFGYRDAQHYYQENSSIDFFSKVRVPLLCLSSWDDPITGPHVIRLAQQAAAKSDFCTVAVTTKGGHVAFLEANPNFSLCKRWASWKSSFADRVGIKFLASALDCTNN